MINSTHPTPDFYCTDWSLAIDEPMAGTAVSNKIWLFLEYNQLWTAKATNDNSLPQPVQAWLAEQGGEVNGRLQFIKQPRGKRTGWAFFVAVFSDVESCVYRFELPTYDALFALDLPAIVAGADRYASHRTREPQLMVCTNGKRDVCCALQGVALLRALTVPLGSAVWQTTHLGGHRFAATLLTVPDGVNYGRLAPQDVPELLAHLQQNSLWLEKLRGRACYDPVTQVAEHALRQETAESSLTAYPHLATQLVTDGTWHVQFQSPQGEPLQVAVEATEPLTTYPSSGQIKTKTVPQFRASYQST